MNSFDSIREDAARRRDQLGLDVDASAMTVVHALLAKLDIRLTLLQRGNVALVGARAVFDEQFRSICAEEIGDEGELAALVAHEIAHAVLHLSSANCSNDDIDPSRPTEVAPVGLQRVDSYGAHERRELHANVFAREVLLPRAIARRLHVDERMSASAIGEALHLPRDMVRQQVLDALLLPSLSEEPEPSEEQERRDDPTQATAAAHRGSAFLLQAGPGTGKTRTLVKRVESLLAAGRDPTSILVLTFSNRAAGELFERLAKAAPEAASKIWIGTFHAFGLDLVRRYHDRFDLPPDPPLFDRSDAIEVLQDLLPTLPLKHYRNLWDPLLVLKDIVTAISRAKDEVVDSAGYRKLAQAMLDRARADESLERAEKCLEIADVYDRYQAALAAQRAVDFGDLIMRPTLLLESDSTVREIVRLRHRHVLVDEYQDVNRASARLLRAIAGDGKRLWVVGDARQSIYRFRGASSANMRSFSTDYEGAGTSQLGVSYRSSKEIIDTFTAFSRGMGASASALPLSLTSAVGTADQLPEVRVFETLDEEEGGVAASVRELEASGIALRDQAVLCRTNRRLNEVAGALEARGIAVLHLGSFFEREDIRDALALMSLAVDRSGAGLVRVGVLARYKLSLQDVFVATHRLQEQEKGTALQNLDAAASDPALSPQGRESLGRLQRDLEGLTSSTSPWDFLATYLLDRTRDVAELAARDTIRSRMQSIALWQLLNFLRQPRPKAAGPPIRRMLEQVKQLVVLAEERDLRHIPAAAVRMNAVRLMTVHASKGLEFEAVHIPSVTTASFPSSSRASPCPAPDGLEAWNLESNALVDARAAHEEEEECLFFVATSRARSHLRMYRATRQASGKARTASSFLAGLPVRELERSPVLPLAAGAMTLGSIQVTWPKTHAWVVSDLELFEKCPRRFFYTRALGLRVARSATPFSLAHDCLIELIKWLVKTRVAGAVTADDAERELDRIWKERGPVEHAFAKEYRLLASRLAQALVRHGASGRYREPARLPVKLPHGTVFVEPEEVASHPDGTVVVRRIRTGRRRSDEYERLAYTLYRLGARLAFGPKVRVEALHLTSDIVEAVEVTDRVTLSRQERADAILDKIARGLYPPTPTAFTCPRCPHFFICAATPHGPVELREREAE